MLPKTCHCTLNLTNDTKLSEICHSFQITVLRQLSGARLCPDWDLLRTFLCTLRTGSRCTIVQNSVVFLSDFRAFRCFCPHVHVRPHLRAHKYLNPDNEDYSDVCTAINISTAGLLGNWQISTPFSANALSLTNSERQRNKQFMRVCVMTFEPHSICIHMLQ